MHMTPAEEVNLISQYMKKEKKLEIEKIVDLCIEKEDILVDKLRMLFEDMRSNAMKLRDVETNIELLERAFAQMKY